MVSPKTVNVPCFVKSGTLMSASLARIGPVKTMRTTTASVIDLKTSRITESSLSCVHPAAAPPGCPVYPKVPIRIEAVKGEVYGAERGEPGGPRCRWNGVACKGHAAARK